MNRSRISEPERLAALHELDMLEAGPDDALDGLVEAAATSCGTAMSLISLIDTDRQWLKASVGVRDTRPTPRRLTFCDLTIRRDGVLEIADAISDPRFARNPFVTGEPHVRFYAGVSLRLAGGACVGTLCVLDSAPRTLSNTQKTMLQHLGTAAVRILESRCISRRLATSEARFRALVDAASLGMFETDADGKCVYVDERWQGIFGTTAAQATGNGWARGLHPDDRSAVFLEWQRTTGLQRDFRQEFRILRAGGSVRHVRALSRPVVDERGHVTGHVGSVEDITEQRTRELALRKSETLLGDAGVLADVGGWDLDLASRKLTWTDQTCRIHGMPPGHQPTLEEAFGFYPREARAIIRDAVRFAIEDGSGWELELPFTRADGASIWVQSVGHVQLEDGGPVRLIGAFRNITRQVEQRQALERAHERMLLATESGGIGIWDWNVVGKVIDLTPRMHELFGRPGGPERVDENWLRHVHEDDREALRHGLRVTLANLRQLDCEFRIRWPDGSLRHLCIAARATCGADGRVVRLLGVCWDVTPLRELSDELADQHELLQVALQSIGDAVITADESGRVRWLNPAAERMTGWTCAQAAGHALRYVFHVVSDETGEPADDPVAACLRQGEKVSSSARTTLVARDGAELGIEESAAPIRNRDGDILGAVLVFRDVTEQRRLANEMSYRASHDTLTGLLNRSEFELRLERVRARAHTDGSRHALMYIDLDQFKLVNDACGHAVGDRLLRQVAALLADAARAGDTLARIGGDEFAVILEDCAGTEALAIGQTICDRMDDFRLVHEKRRFRIGTSIGLVPIDTRWTSVAPALQAADAACYAAKEAGRNRVHEWFDTDRSLRERNRERQWASRLEQAIDEGRFTLFGQRIGALAGGATALHAEVLLRLADENGTMISPGVFLPAAERFHLATRLDRWVLTQVIEQVEALTDLDALGTLCVNLSGQSLGDRAFHDIVIAALEAAGNRVCSRLCLEITETAAITDMPHAVAFAEQARTLGVRIALDDFGAGASSFGYLRDLPVDVLKIDGQFVQNMIDDPLDDAAVRCFVEVARLTGLRTVAEYVDRVDIMERVREIGIDFMQGFLLHEPEPLADLLAGRSAERALPAAGGSRLALSGETGRGN